MGMTEKPARVRGVGPGLTTAPTHDPLLEQASSTATMEGAAAGTFLAFISQREAALAASKCCWVL